MYCSSRGWQDDTLCEDLDLSYRAQLQGWEFLYLPLWSPRQNSRHESMRSSASNSDGKRLYADGAEVGGALLRTSDVPWYKRLQGLIHLTGYLVHPLMVILLLLTLPFLLTHSSVGGYVGFLSLVSFCPPLLYAVSQWALYRAEFPKRFSAFPLLVLLGTGVAWNNSRAVWEAFTGRKSQFMRTPKFHIERRQDTWTTTPPRCRWTGTQWPNWDWQPMQIWRSGWRCMPAITSSSLLVPLHAQFWVWAALVWYIPQARSGSGASGSEWNLGPTKPRGGGVFLQIDRARRGGKGWCLARKRLRI